MDNKFQDFLDVIYECNIINKEDYATFMAVTKEHCLDKGITDYEAIKENWLRFKANLSNIVKEIKDGKERLTGN